MPRKLPHVLRARSHKRSSWMTMNQWALAVGCETLWVGPQYWSADECRA